jgi:uncharacterized membrane protein
MIEAIKTFLLAMTPIGELRIALPVALTLYDMNWVWAFFISVLGNLVPVVFLLLFLEPVSKRLSNNSKFFQKFFSWLFEKTRKKSSPGIEKYGEIALASFVAIPLPLTGAWTGAVVAFLFGIPFKKAFLLIALGVVIAGGIVLALTQLGLLWLI